MITLIPPIAEPQPLEEFSTASVVTFSTGASVAGASVTAPLGVAVVGSSVGCSVVGSVVGASVGCSVVGDMKYGDTLKNKSRGVARQCLVAKSLRFSFENELAYLNEKTFVSRFDVEL